MHKIEDDPDQRLKYSEELIKHGQPNTRYCLKPTPSYTFVWDIHKWWYLKNNLHNINFINYDNQMPLQKVINYTFRQMYW